MVIERFLTQLFAAAAQQLKERLIAEQGPFMEPEAFRVTELCNQFIYDADYMLTNHL